MIPASASEMSIKVRSMTNARSDSSMQSASASGACAGSSARKSDLGDPSQSRQRRAEVVRDVVQRLAHAADQRLVALQHAVDQRRQLAELAAAPHLHATGEIARLDHGARRGGQGPNGAQGAPGQKDPACDPDEEAPEQHRQNRRRHRGTKPPPGVRGGCNLETQVAGHRCRHTDRGILDDAVLVEGVAGSVLDAHGAVLAFELGRAFDRLFELRQSDAAEHFAVAFEPLTDDDLVRLKDGVADLVERQRAQDGQADQKSASVPGAEAERDRPEWRPRRFRGRRCFPTIHFLRRTYPTPLRV